MFGFKKKENKEKESKREELLSVVDGTLIPIEEVKDPVFSQKMMGDGFAVARLLEERGVRVTAAFVGKEQSLSEEANLQKKICENCGIKISTNFMHREYTTIVDAIFGIGLSREVTGPYADVIDWMNQQPSKIVSVDIPSGI